MKKIKLFSVLLVLSISSLFFIKGIFGYFTKVTVSNVNNITISQNTSYTVVHETMNLDGTTYTEYERNTYNNIPLGTTVSPEVLNIEGFTSPTIQTVTLDSLNNVVITYRYTRKQYTLTINNSNYVTTTTPSGTYYYGEEIHLVAAPLDSNGNPFSKWTNNVTNRDYTFIIKNNTTIGPLYAEGYKITYMTNNGESPIIDYVAQNHSLGTLPIVTYNDCNGGTGDYHQRQCTYVYKFEGWYKEVNFITQVNENFVPNKDTVLYAKWNKIYFSHDEPFTCNGSNYIDTEIKMFNQLNADKNFIITFTVDENNGYNSSTNDRGTIFTDMNEVGEPFPGVHFYTDQNENYTININRSGNKVKNTTSGYVTGQSVVIKKENGKVYYSYDNGAFNQINDFSTFNNYFDNSASFCAGINKNGAYYRFFDGVISNMSVELIDPEYYVLHFDSNGGTGMMIDQVIRVGKSSIINTNAFLNQDGTFKEWNTLPDGTGTSYPDNYTITSDLGNNGDIITLYAQWLPADHYFVHFDSNGGIGTMEDQKFIIDSVAQPLSKNSFVKDNYVFVGWNTSPDGTGTHYDDEQAVSNLSNTNEAVITLYAEWMKIQYSHPGDAVFDGTINTFIDTGINIFNSDNIDKDFEIRFTFKSVDSDILSVSPTQPTFFNAKDESNNKYPGINIRFNGSIDTMNASYRWGGSTVNVPSTGISTSNVPIEFVYKRKNGVLTMQYSYEGFKSQIYTLFNQSSWTLNKPFASNVAFGGYFGGNNQPGRFFKGTLSDMIILMND